MFDNNIITLIIHESEVFICKALKDKAIVELLRVLNNTADESLRLARRADNLEAIKEEFEKIST